MENLVEETKLEGKLAATGWPGFLLVEIP